MGPGVKRSDELHLIRSGARTRTLNNWTRTSCVANYTTPEGLGKPTRDAEEYASDGCQLRSVEPRMETLKANNATDAHFEGLLHVVLPQRVLDRRRIAHRRRRRRESLG